MIFGKKGFTLIEIIIVIVIIGILGAFTLAFLNHATTMYMIGARQRMIYQEASYIMERITRELRDAQTVTSGSESLTITKIHTAGNMDNSPSVTFSKDGNGNIVRSSGGISRIMGRRATGFNPILNSCSAGSSDCKVVLSLQLTDPNIPINNASARSITLVTTISPKNLAPSINPYAGRCFNGDYENSIQ